MSNWSRPQTRTDSPVTNTRRLSVNGSTVEGGTCASQSDLSSSRNQNSDEGETSRPAKRRRRAAIACDRCRSRKTRCDNQRPCCGYCAYQSLPCRYPDAPYAEPDTVIDASNVAILDKVCKAVALLEELKSEQERQRHPPDTANTRTGGVSHQCDAPRISQSRTTPTGHQSAFTDGGFGQLQIPEEAARASACESILRWPCIQRLHTVRDVVSLGLETEHLHGTTTTKTPSHSLIQQDEIPSLCRRFLDLIHIKNPILDVSEFLGQARHAAELGPGWDEGGCLVLLACALASLATPYNPIEARSTIDHFQEGQISLPSDLAESLDKAEAYFNAAQRRLGTLPNRLIAVQCQYLAGLYAKFVIRPFLAWNLLQGACVQLQALLYVRGLRSNKQGEPSQAARARHIEQRLYWSCIKAECELRVELQLPSSGLLRFKYPDPFPSLSFPSGSAADSALVAAPTPDLVPAEASTPWSASAWQTSPGSTSSMRGGDVEDTLHPEEERSWLYYLAEISLRSLMNHVLTELYVDDAGWLSSTSSGLSRRQVAFVKELEQWHAVLPPQLAFENTVSGTRLSLPHHELPLFLQTRYISLLEWIYRPSLYRVLHGHSDPSDTIECGQLCQGAINSAAALIIIVSVHHRHGGIWGLIRRSFGAAVILCAASRHVREQSLAGNTSLFRLPSNWRSLVTLSAGTIQRWEGSGATNLSYMHRILSEILSSSEEE